MGEKKDEYIGAFPREDRYIFAIFLVLLAISPYIPFPETPITPATRNFYAAIENVPDGGAYMWSTDFDIGVWYEMAAPEIATYHHMFTRAQEDGCKVVLVATFYPQGWMAAEKILREEVRPDDYGLVYGEDYVMLGWIPGYETTLAGLMSDLWTIAGGKDYQGTAFTDLPMMDNLRGAGDFHLLGYSTSTSPDPYARQWGVGMGSNTTPMTMKDGQQLDGAMMIGNAGTATVAWLMPYIESGIQTSYLSGQRGGAEYEILLDRPGMGGGFMAGQSIGHFYAIALVIVTNALYLLERRR
jgi:hypothetical protein